MPHTMNTNYQRRQGNLTNTEFFREKNIKISGLDLDNIL